MYIHVVLTPSAKKEKIEKLTSDHFAVWVKPKPLQNLANKRLIEMLAEYFILPTNKVRIVSGHHSRKKIVTLDEE